MATLAQAGSPKPARGDDSLMRRCLQLAEIARRSGETAVGSLIARDGKILGEGIEGTRNLLDPSAHAEIQAIRSACGNEYSLDLTGSTLYTTVEPCVLCAYAIRRAGVARVVYGIPCGQAGGATSRYNLLTDETLTGWPPPPEIQSGVLAAECLEMLNRPRASDRGL